jgi:integrase/archaellum biogenesis ATPase FlaH
MTTNKKSRRKGVEIYSPWYSGEFVQEKLELKKTELAKLELAGDIRSAEGWNEKARRRFQLHFDRLADETKRSYQSAARHFAKYLGLPKSEAKVSNIVARLILLAYLEATTLIEEYVMWMQTDLELAPATINVRLAALRWFVDASRRVGWVEWKLDVKNVKGGKVTDTSGPSEAEFRRILRVVNSMPGPAGARTKALVYMLAFMGVRISSAISLDMDNIDREERSIRVRWKGKGETRAHYVWRPVGEETFEALEDWIKVRGDKDGPVFVAVDRSRKSLNRLSIRSSQRDIERVGREAATRKKLTPHGFRHFFATNNLKEEGDTRRVMKATGHTNIKTIEAYDDSDDQAAREVVESMENRWLEDLEAFEDEDIAEIQERYGGNSESDDDSEAGDLEDMGVFSATAVAASSISYNRISTGMDSVDALFGGKGNQCGLVRGSLVLLGGAPGIGKSTLSRQICYNICEANPGVRVLYGSAEETPQQISEALERLDCSHDNLFLIGERSINRITEVADKLNASVVVIDSVSTVAVDGVNKRPGSVTQVKSAGQLMLDWCKGVDGGKGSDAVVILIAHITSSGDIAGPKELEHHVDVICAFNSPSKRSKQRSLGCEGKNRFGDATKEIFFEMTGKGLVERTMVSDGGDESDSDYSVFEGDYEENEESYDVEGFEIHTGKSKPKNDFG